MDDLAAGAILADIGGGVLAGHLDPAGVRLHPQQILGDLGVDVVEAEGAVLQGDKLKVVVVVQQLHAGGLHRRADLLHRLNDDGVAGGIVAVLLRQIGHHQIIHADDPVIGNHLVNVRHHIRQRHMGAEGDQADLGQGVPDIGRLQAVGTGQFHAVIAHLLDGLHDRFKLVGGVFQQVAQAVDLNANGQLAHKYLFFLHKVWCPARSGRTQSGRGGNY